jgi:hypothetical protein
VGAVAVAAAAIAIRLALAAVSSDGKMPAYIHKLADDTTEDSTVRLSSPTGLPGRKGHFSVSTKEDNKENKYVALSCFQPLLQCPAILMTFGVTVVLQCHIVSQCVTSFSFPNLHISGFFCNVRFFFHSVKLCLSITHRMGVTLVPCVGHVKYIIASCH